MLDKLREGPSFRVDDLLLNRGALIEEIDLRDLDAADRMFAVHEDGEDLSALAASLQDEGQLDPIVVRKHEGRWQLVDGFRRVQAARWIGLTHLQARRFDRLSEWEAALWVVKNIHVDLPHPEALRALSERLRLSAHAEAAEVVARYAQSVSVVDDEVVAPETEEVEVTPDELADEVSAGFSSMSESLQLVQEHWADLTADRRAALLEQLKYFADLHAYLSADDAAVVEGSPNV